jgi:hypothetical protein
MAAAMGSSRILVGLFLGSHGETNLQSCREGYQASQK